MKTFVILLCTLAFTAAVTEVNRLTQVDHMGRIVYMDIIHDIEEKTVMAIIGDVSKYENGVQTVNFHDYNVGYGVLKDVNSKICILAKSLVPMATAEKYRMGYTTEVHVHQLQSFKVLPSILDVINIAGGKIAEFCKDYTTVLAKAVPVEHQKRDKPSKTDPETHQSPQARWCMFSFCIASENELQAALHQSQKLSAILNISEINKFNHKIYFKRSFPS